MRVISRMASCSSKRTLRPIRRTKTPSLEIRTQKTFDLLHSRGPRKMLIRFNRSIGSLKYFQQAKNLRAAQPVNFRRLLTRSLKEVWPKPSKPSWQPFKQSIYRLTLPNWRPSPNTSTCLNKLESRTWYLIACLRQLTHANTPVPATAALKMFCQVSQWPSLKCCCWSWLPTTWCIWATPRSSFRICSIRHNRKTTSSSLCVWRPWMLPTNSCSVSCAVTTKTMGTTLWLPLSLLVFGLDSSPSAGGTFWQFWCWVEPSTVSRGWS